MSVLLYAIVADTAAPPAGLAGLQQRPLRAVAAARPAADEPTAGGGLSALVSDLAAELGRDLDTMLAYEQVIEELADRIPALLPAQFGTTTRDDAAVRALLAERAPQFRRALRDVEGAVEFAVRTPAADPVPAMAAAAPAGDPGAGTAYMQALVARSRSEQQLDAAVAGLFRRRRETVTGRSTSYLVERAKADEFTARLEALGATVTGPWPPYSFVQEELT